MPTISQATHKALLAVYQGYNTAPQLAKRFGISDRVGRSHMALLNKAGLVTGKVIENTFGMKTYTPTGNPYEVSTTAPYTKKLQERPQETPAERFLSRPAMTGHIPRTARLPSWGVLI